MQKISLLIEPHSEYKDEQVFVSVKILLPNMKSEKITKTGILKSELIEPGRVWNHWPGEYPLSLFSPDGLSIEDVLDFHLDDIPSNTNLEFDIVDSAPSESYSLRLNKKSLSFRIWFDTIDWQYSFSKETLFEELIRLSKEDNLLRFDRYDEDTDADGYAAIYFSNSSKGKDKIRDLFERDLHKITLIKEKALTNLLLIQKKALTNLLQKFGVANEIVRKIEFEPEYYQAGMSIISNFGSYLEKRHLGKNNKITIEQNGRKVIMTIETETGQKDIVEEELRKYGLVISNELAPEEIFPNNRLDQIELKVQLNSYKMLVENQKLLLQERKDRIDEKSLMISNLMEVIKNSFSRPITQTVNNQIETNQNISNSVELKIEHNDKKEIEIFLKKFEEKENIDLGKNDLEKIKVLLTKIKNDIEEDKPNFWTLKDNFKSINNLLQGAVGSIFASNLLPHIEIILNNLSKYL